MEKVRRRFYKVALINILILLCVSCYGQSAIKGKRISRNNVYAITNPDPKRPNYVRMEVRKGEIASNGGRAELMAENSGFEQEYSFSFKVEKYHYELDKHFIIADWHHSTELHKIAASKGENLYSPLVVHLVGDNIVLANRAGRFTGEVGDLILDSKFKMNMLRVPIDYNGWNDVYVKIVWADKNQGSVYAKINDKEIYVKNIRTTYDMNYANFYKVGIYRNLTYASDAIFLFKDLMVGNKMLVPDFSRKLTGEKNNDERIIKSVQEKHKK